MIIIMVTALVTVVTLSMTVMLLGVVVYVDEKVAEMKSKDELNMIRG